MGLADLLQPRVAEVGKIKIGYLGEERETKGGKKWRMPQKLDRFLITTCERRDGRLVIDEPLMRSLLDTHGERSADGKPVLRQLPIYVLSDEIDDVLRARWVRYDGRKCLETCDGREHTDRTTGEVRPCQITSASSVGPVSIHSHKGQPGWKLHGHFSCVIAASTARFGGIYSFRTTSEISLSQLYGGLLHIQTLTGGILTGVPLRLVVRPIEVTPEGKATTVYVVHLELHAVDLRQVQADALAAAQYRAQHYSQIRAAQQQYAALLPPPGDEDGDEIEAIVEEYHPEQLAAPAVDPLAALRTEPEADREPGEEG